MFESLPLNEKIIFCAYIVVIGLVLVGIFAFAIAFLKIASKKFIKSCKKISDFCNEAGVINGSNLEQFEATCIDDNTNEAFLEGWEAFKVARFGYPSEKIDKNKIMSYYDAHNFKFGVAVYSLVLFIIDVIVAIYAIITTNDSNEYALAYAICSMIIPLIPLVIYLPLKPQKKAEIALEQTLDDLDTVVRLQRLVERKIDNTRLNDITGKIKDIILAEQSKAIPSKKDQLAKRKAREELLAEADDDLNDIIAEPVEEVVEEQVAEPVEEAVEEPVVEEEAVAEPVEEVVEEEPVVEEPVQEEKPAPKKVIPFEPFSQVLDDTIDKIKNKDTMKKLGNILVLAFTKFKEPQQRESLKNSIRKFITNYQAIIDRDNNLDRDENAIEYTDEPTTQDVNQYDDQEEFTTDLND